MQDEQLKKLTSAYIEKEIDFEEYRELRTGYIDTLTGFKDETKTSESSETNIEESDPSEPERELSPFTQLLLSTAFIVTLFLLLLYFFKPPVSN